MLVPCVDIFKEARQVAATPVFAERRFLARTTNHFGDRVQRSLFPFHSLIPAYSDQVRIEASLAKAVRNLPHFQKFGPSSRSHAEPLAKLLARDSFQLTRKAYANATREFLSFCEQNGVSSLAAIQPAPMMM